MGTRGGRSLPRHLKESLHRILMLKNSTPSKTLSMYLAASNEAISSVLMVERVGRHFPIYFPKKSDGLAKWAIELDEHDIEYRPNNSIKGQTLADFLIEIPGDPQDGPSAAVEEQQKAIESSPT
ncbi:hypothetical protein LXL04_032515 [Taraxacum kok-saghyz]